MKWVFPCRGGHGCALVAPHAGAGIEITADNNVWEPGVYVAPHAGAGIEISSAISLLCCARLVAPHAGAGIEIRSQYQRWTKRSRRPPRGGGN